MRALAGAVVALAACGGPAKPPVVEEAFVVPIDAPSASCLEVARVVAIVGDIDSKDPLPATCSLVPVKERDKKYDRSNFRVECKVARGEEPLHCEPLHSIDYRYGTATVDAMIDGDIIWYRRLSPDRPLADALPPPELVPDVVAYVARLIAAFPQKFDGLIGIALADERDYFASKLCITGVPRCRFVNGILRFPHAEAVLFRGDAKASDKAYDDAFRAIDGAKFPIAFTHPPRSTTTINRRRTSEWNVATKRADGDIGIILHEAPDDGDLQRIWISIGPMEYVDPNRVVVTTVVAPPDPNAPPTDWEKTVGDLDWASIVVDHEWLGAQTGLAVAHGRAVPVTSRLKLELKLGTNDIVGILQNTAPVELDGKKLNLTGSSGIRGTLDRKSHTLTLRTNDVPPPTKEGVVWCGFSGSLEVFRRGESLTKPILQIRGSVTTTCGSTTAKAELAYEYNPNRY